MSDALWDQAKHLTDTPCLECHYGTFDCGRGLDGGWRCDHPDNPGGAPKLAVRLFEQGQPVVCRIMENESL